MNTVEFRIVWIFFCNSCKKCKQTPDSHFASRFLMDSTTEIRLKSGTMGAKGLMSSDLEAITSLVDELIQVIDRYIASMFVCCSCVGVTWNSSMRRGFR